MKKMFVFCLSSFLSMYASAEYKVINLVNGTNDVQVEGAILPIAIEVKSTVTDKLVRVSRVSDVDVLKKVYDVTTNEIRWTDIQIVTNDYFTLNNSLLTISEDSEVVSDSRYSYYLYADENYVMSWNYCFTNRNISATPITMSFPGSSVSVNSITKNGDLYVAATSKGMWYTSNPAIWNRCVMTEGLEREQFYSCYYGGGIYVAQFAYALAISYDGVNWEYSDKTDDMEKGIYANGKYLHISGAGGLYVGNHPTKMTQVVSSSTHVVDICYGNGLYVFSDINGRVWYSVDAITWEKSEFSFSPYRVQDIFFDSVRKCFYLKLYINDGRGTLDDYSYATSDFVTFNTLANSFDAHIMCSTTNGVVYALAFKPSSINVRPVKLSVIGSQHYSHISGYVGTSERWSAGNGFYIDYNPNSYSEGRYWKQTTGDNVSYLTEKNQRPSYLKFPAPCVGSTSDAVLSYSRATNYIEHIRYEYITNRVYNVIDKTVTTVAKIVDAQCSGGVNSEEITNRVFVIGGDKLFVDGVLQNEEQSTKATLIVQ